MRVQAVPIAAFGKHAAVVAGLICATAVSGCAGTEEYQLGQRIDMGPYSFEVVRADKGTWASIPTINILFRLTRDDTAPFTTDFSSSFAFKMEAVDAAGNTFTVDPHAVSPVHRAGRYRSDRYRAEVRLSPSLEGVRNATHIGKAVEDFRLIIDNPAHEGKQPRRVAIQLH
jgi:hypothetical protein